MALPRLELNVPFSSINSLALFKKPLPEQLGSMTGSSVVRRNGLFHGIRDVHIVLSDHQRFVVQASLTISQVRCEIVKSLTSPIAVNPLASEHQRLRHLILTVGHDPVPRCRELLEEWYLGQLLLPSAKHRLSG